MDNIRKEVEDLFKEKQDQCTEIFDTTYGFNIKEWNSSSLLNLSKYLSPKLTANFLLIKFGIPVIHVYKLLRYPGKKSCIKDYQKAIKILHDNDVPIKAKVIQKLRFNK